MVEPLGAKAEHVCQIGNRHVLHGHLKGVEQRRVLRDSLVGRRLLERCSSHNRAVRHYSPHRLDERAAVRNRHTQHVRVVSRRVRHALSTHDLRLRFSVALNPRQGGLHRAARSVEVILHHARRSLGHVLCGSKRFRSAHVRFVNRSLGFVCKARERGNRDRHEHADNGNDRQQLHEREALLATGCPLHYHSQLCRSRVFLQLRELYLECCLTRSSFEHRSRNVIFASGTGNLVSRSTAFHQRK